jgi:hypothetical protein
MHVPVRGWARLLVGSALAPFIMHVSTPGAPRGTFPSFGIPTTTQICGTGPAGLPGRHIYAYIHIESTLHTGAPSADK